MFVRRAQHTDALAIAEVHIRSWQEAYRGLLPDALLDGLRVEDRFALWKRVLPDPTQDVFVAEGPEGAVVGFISLMASRDEDAVAGTGEVSSLYLLEAHWGRGYGRALMEAVVAAARAREFRQLTLWVLASNLRARRFYAAAGFAADGTEKLETRPGGLLLEECRYRIALPS